MRTPARHLPTLLLLLLLPLARPYGARALVAPTTGAATPASAAGATTATATTRGASPLFRRDVPRRRRAADLRVSSYASPPPPASAAGAATDRKSTRAASPFRPGPRVAFGSSGLKLNLFGFLYGLHAVLWGTIWWASMSLCQIAYALSGNRLDEFRRWPVALSHVWGTVVMRAFGCYPRITGRENIRPILEANRGKRRGERTPVMFVANHCSWMDIPFVGVTIGWRNYKIVAKRELLKVPILSKSIRSGGNVVLDRTDRRSQLDTFKRGVQYLRDGVNLVTFPEGTRSKTGRMGPYKKGAFKMAQKVGAPIVPLSVRYANKIQPVDYVFPVRPSFRIGAGVHIGRPIYTEGKTDDEVMEEVWNAVADGLPEEQRPEDGTPVSAS